MILPLPQLESQLPYGVRMSLPDMIIDQRARTELEATDLEQGRYLYTFISMTSSERVFASLIQHYQSWNASLDTLLEVRYSGQGFVTSNGSIILRLSLEELVFRFLSTQREFLCVGIKRRLPRF